MKLLHALVSGIGSDAASGTARIYKRGGATRATYYLDFEGTVVVTNGADVNLDSKGRAVRYVSEYVQVDVYSSQGVLVTSFVDGESAGDVECRSVAFTGTDYLTGQSGVSKPTTLAAILDRWLASAGTVDFKVATAAGNINLQQFAQFVGLFISVKDPTYGATGDGTTDDTVAINAALDAADALGGIVFFPPGTYRTTAALTPGQKCWLWGCGSGASIISCDHATTGVAFSGVTASAGEHQEIRGLAIRYQQASAQILIDIGRASVLVTNCQLGESVNHTSGIFNAQDADGCKLIVEHCTIRRAPATGSWIPIGVSAGATPGTHLITFKACRFIMPAGAVPSTGQGIFNCQGGTDGQIDGCIFDLSAVVAGGPVVVNCASNINEVKRLVIGNCIVIDPGGTAVSEFIAHSIDVAAGSLIYETGNRVGFDPARTRLFANSINFDINNGARYRSATREGAYREATDNAAAASVPSREAANILWHRTVAGGQTLTIDDAPLGGHLWLTLWNDGTGGNIIFTWPADTETGAATTTVADNMTETWHFVRMAGPTVGQWKAVAAGVEDTET